MDLDGVYYSEPIDIYGEWCDEIAAANEQGGVGAVADDESDGGGA